MKTIKKRKYTCEPFPHTERDKKIIKFYKEGKTMKAIANIFHLSPARVCKIINKKH